MAHRSKIKFSGKNGSAGSLDSLVFLNWEGHFYNATLFHQDQLLVRGCRARMCNVPAANWVKGML